MKLCKCIATRASSLYCRVPVHPDKPKKPYLFNFQFFGKVIQKIFQSANDMKIFIVLSESP